MKFADVIRAVKACGKCSKDPYSGNGSALEHAYGCNICLGFVLSKVADRVRGAIPMPFHVKKENKAGFLFVAETLFRVADELEGKERKNGRGRKTKGRK